MLAFDLITVPSVEQVLVDRFLFRLVPNRLDLDDLLHEEPICCRQNRVCLQPTNHRVLLHLQFLQNVQNRLLN